MVSCARGVLAHASFFVAEDKELTSLLIHVLHVSHPTALQGSTNYAREIVDRFFLASLLKVSHIEPHKHKFRNLAVKSRLEIAFAGRRKGFNVPKSKFTSMNNQDLR